MCVVRGRRRQVGWLELGLSLAADRFLSSRDLTRRFVALFIAEDKLFFFKFSASIFTCMHATRVASPSDENRMRAFSWTIFFLKEKKLSMYQ